MHWFKTKDGRYINLAMVTDTNFNKAEKPTVFRVFFAAMSDGSGQAMFVIDDPDDIARLTRVLDGLAAEHPHSLPETEAP